MRYLLPLASTNYKAAAVALRAPQHTLSRTLGTFSKLMQYVAKPPSQSVPTWTRLAHKVKSPEAASCGSPGARHLETLRQSYGVEDTVGKLEQEFMEEIAGALGRTGNKCVYYFKEMKAALRAFEDVDAAAASQAPFSLAALNARREAAAAFHQALQQAEDARRELIIHRQACGFTHNNYGIVESAFPLPARVRVTSFDRAAELQSLSGHKLSLIDEAGLRAELHALGVPRDADGRELGAMAKPELLAVLARTIQAL